MLRKELTDEPRRQIRLAAFLAIALTLIGSARIASTYKVFNFTIDEPEHAACGIKWLDAGKYDYDLINPPLSHIVAALGLHYAGRHWDGDSNMWYEGVRVLGGGSRLERGLVYARAAMLPFFWIGAAVVFLWSLRAAGPLAAVLATAFFTTLPPILAHAGLVTTDMALTAMLGAAVLASIYWVESPTPRMTLIFGAAVGLAVTAKFSAIVFLPAAWVVMLVGRFCSRRENPLREFSRLRTTLSIFTRPPQSRRLLVLLSVRARRKDSHRDADHPRHRDRDGLAFPASCWIATRVFRRRPAVRHDQPHQHWIAPRPAGLHRLLHRRGRRARSYDSAVFTALARRRRYCTAGRACSFRGPPASGLSGLHQRLLVASSRSGPGRFGCRWGTGYEARLADRLQSLGVRSLYFNPFNRGYLTAGHPFPEIRPVPEGDEPPRGWTAVSITMWKLGRGPRWLAWTHPEERIGRSMLLFHRR